MELTNAIFKRRSVRQYLDKPIDKDILLKLVHSGMYAPSARNSRPWEFVIITKKETLQELSDIRPYWKMLKNAAAAIVVLGNISSYASSTKDFFIQDCSASTQNILLMAHEYGIGSVWLGLHPLEKEQELVRKVLDIPSEIIPFSIISLGYPAKDISQPDRIEHNKIFWEEYYNKLNDDAKEE